MSGVVIDVLPPLWLLRLAVAAVWLYEGLWCKLCRGDARQFEIVAAVPRYGARFGAPFLLVLGVVELLLGIWVLAGTAPVSCALTQTALLLALNLNGLLWSRHLIHDPAGMLLKNGALLVLAWVAASPVVGS